MAKKRIRFDYKNATLEELRAYKTKLYESNKKLFGATPRARYQEVTERFHLPSTMGQSFTNPQLERAELTKQISIMTGGYEYHRAKVARDNLKTMITKLSHGEPNEAMLEFVGHLSLQDIMRHSEEYDYLFRILEGYGETEEEGSTDQDILEDIADSLKDEIYKDEDLTFEWEEYINSLDESEILDAPTFEEYVWHKWGLE